MLELEKNFVSAVIYVHNDAERIRDFLEMVRDVLEKNFLHSEIICVNDASNDRSVEEIREASKDASATGISVLTMSFYHGVELSMNAGMDLAIGDFVFEFDSAEADFPPELIMTIYRRSLEGYDIVSAAPGGKREVASSLFYYLFDKFSHVTYSMRTERFRILSRRVINRISSMNKSVPYRKAVYANCGFPMDTVDYDAPEGKRVWRDREEMVYRERLAVDAMLLFTDVGSRLAMAMTSIMMAVAVFMAGYALLTYVESSPVAGWTTTILFLSFAFFCLFGILTLVAKYLQLIIQLVFQRKRYSFEGIEKLTK